MQFKPFRSTSSQGKYLLITGWLFLITLVSYCQNSIFGKVLNDATGKPLVNASVYINNSTIGVATNEAGEFTLAGVKDGVYDIVASYIGYEIGIYRATLQSKNLKLEFRLILKVAELRNVMVLNKAGREKWMKLFRENFLGITAAAERCKIENEDDIFFDGDAPKGVIKAFSDVPLIIINRELGYRISFDLKGFYLSETEHRTSFYGYSRFEELSDKEKIPRRYSKERKNYYRGSTAHFFYSLTHSQLTEEGFSLLLYQPVTITGDSSFMKKDSAGNAQRNRPQLVRAVRVQATDILLDTVIAGSGNHYRLDWNGKLQIRYNKDPYGKEFLKKKIFMQGNAPVGFVCTISIVQRPVLLDAKGELENPLTLEYSGYWSYEKVANMLPIDYRPD